MGDVKPLIVEQSSLPTQPGPRLTCTDSSCEGTYVGKEWGPNGEDIGHRYSNTVADDVGKHLKKLYKNGKFSKVDLNNIKMSVKGYGTGDIEFYVKVPFERVSDKCDAMTSFDHSGSWAGTPQLDNRKNELSKLLLPGDTFEISNPIKSAGLTEYWIQWRSSIQSECGGGQPTSSQEESIKIIYGSEPGLLRTELIKLGVVYDPKFIRNDGTLEVTFNQNKGTNRGSLSYIYSNEGEKGLKDVYNNVKFWDKESKRIKNEILWESRLDFGGYVGYIIFIKP